MSPDRPLHLPPPESHRAGTLRLLDRLGTPRPDREPVRAFIAAREARADAGRGLKYDVYAAPGGAWGVAVADTGEGAAMDDPAWALAERLLPGASRHRARFEAFRATLAPASLVVAVGFDRPDRPPRVKLYLQEATWARPLARAGDLGRWLGPLPGWVPEERPVGVVTLELHADRRPTWKLYLGGPTAEAAVAGAPAPVQGLAARAAALAPSPGWWYLTLRLGGEVRYAVNRIYNPVEQLFRRNPTADAQAWAEVEALHAHVGHAEPLRALRRGLADEPLRVTPTATALAPEGSDVYLAAWETG